MEIEISNQYKKTEFLVRSHKCVRFLGARQDVF